MFDPTMTEFSDFSDSDAERHILSHRVDDSEHVRPKGIKICHLNIDRLMDHLDQLRIFTETHKPHVLCLNETKLVHVPIFFGGRGGRVGGLRMCHPPYHPLDFQGKIQNFCHPTLLKIRFKITVTPPPPQKMGKIKITVLQ